MAPMQLKTAIPTAAPLPCKNVFGLLTSHHITSHHITSHHITSHHITSHHITYG
jgi:hypothetical protein